MSDRMQFSEKKAFSEISTNKKFTSKRQLKKTIMKHFASENYEALLKLVGSFSFIDSTNDTVKTFGFGDLKLKNINFESLLAIIYSEIESQKIKFLKFKNLKRRISIAVVNSEWDLVSSLNLELIKNFGVSSLSVHNEVLINRNLGDKHFEEWYTMATTKNPGSLYGFLVYHFSQLTDLSISSLSYRRRTADYINKIEVSQDIKDYLTIKLNRIPTSEVTIQGFTRTVLGIGLTELFNSLDYIIWYLQTDMNNSYKFSDNILSEDASYGQGVYTNLLENISEEFDFQEPTFAFNFFSGENIDSFPLEINQEIHSELNKIRQKSDNYNEAVKKIWKMSDILSSTNAVYFLDTIILMENTRRSFDIDKISIGSRISFLDKSLPIKNSIEKDLNALKNYTSKSVDIKSLNINNKSVASLDILQTLQVDFWESICKSVDLYFQESVYIDIVPLYDILSNKRWVDVKLYKSDIRLVICLNMYCELYPGDERLVSLRSSAWEEFVFSNGITLPSQLTADFFKSLSKYDKALWIYFLRNVCIAEIMDSGVEFESSVAVDEERVKICNLLAQCDSINAKIYQDEILSISTRLKLQEGVSIFDNSRIYVDLDGLISWCKNNLKEEIDKVISIILDDTKKIESDLEFDSAIAEALSFDIRRLEKYLDVPEDDRESLLIYVINEIKEQFLNNNHFGLDRFLSMRVRHGTLSGFLRSTVEKRGLISFKNSSSDAYVSNDYWVSRCLSMDPTTQSSVSKSFSLFSQNFDEIIRKLTQDTLKINNNNDDKGIIKITLSAVSIRSIKRSVDNDTDLRVFVEHVYYALWESIGNSLKEVRDLIKGKINTDLTSSINILRDQIVRKGVEFGDLSLGSAVQEAIDDLQRTTTRLASWFIPSHTRVASRSYTLEEIVDIALSSTSRIHPSILNSVEKNIKAHNKMTTGFMYLLVDILFILIDNIYKHTNDIYEDKAISLSVEEDIIDGSINIICSNRISDSSKDKALDALKRIEELSNSDYKAVEIKNKTEGGTGFYKLHKLINSSQSSNLSAEVNGDIFTVKVNFTIDYIHPKMLELISEATT